MLLSRYQQKFARPPNPSAQDRRGYASLEEDISRVLPYLNTLLKGHEFFREPPSLTLKISRRQADNFNPPGDRD